MVTKAFFKNSIAGAISGTFGLFGYFIFIYFESVGSLGLWSAVSVVLIISQFVEYGLTERITVEIARRRGLRREITIVNSLALFAILGVVLVVLAILGKEYFFALTNIDQNTDKNASNLYDFSVIGIICSSMISGLRSVLYGLDRHLVTNYLVVIGRVIQQIVLCFCIWIDLGVLSLVFALLGYQATFLAISFFKFKKMLKFSLGFFRVLSVRHIKNLVFISKEIFVLKGIHKIFIDELFKILIVRFYGVEVLGSYAISFNLVQLYKKSIESGARLMINQAQVQDRQEILRQLRRINIHILIPLSILGIFVCGVAFRLWEFFPEYDLIIEFLIFLIIAYSVNIFATPHYFVLLSLLDMSTLIKGSLLFCVILYCLFFLQIVFPLDFFLINEIFSYCVALMISSVFIVMKCYERLTFG